MKGILRTGELSNIDQFSLPVVWLTPYNISNLVFTNKTILNYFPNLND